MYKTNTEWYFVELKNFCRETTSDTVIHLMSVSTEKNEVGENVTLDHDNYDEEIDGSAFTINQSITASPEPRTDEKQGTEQRQRFVRMSVQVDR